MLFCNNSKPFYSNFNKPRKDLPLIFPHWRNADHAGFECRFDLVELNELEFILHRNGEPCDKLKSYFFLKENQSVPSSENIKRVTGSTLKGTYLLEGFSTYKKFYIFYLKILVLNLIEIQKSWIGVVVAAGYQGFYARNIKNYGAVILIIQQLIGALRTSV